MGKLVTSFPNWLFLFCITHNRFGIYYVLQTINEILYLNGIWKLLVDKINWIFSLVLLPFIIQLNLYAAWLPVTLGGLKIVKNIKKKKNIAKQRMAEITTPDGIQWKYKKGTSIIFAKGLSKEIKSANTVSLHSYFYKIVCKECHILDVNLFFCVLWKVCVCIIS